jgi:hypothetical protein
LTFLILAVVAAEEMGGVRLAVLGQICGGGFKMLHLRMLCSGFAATSLYLSSWPAVVAGGGGVLAVLLQIVVRVWSPSL